MSGPSPRQPFDVREVEGQVGELRLIAWLIRETCESRGGLEADGKEAVHFLAGLVRERADNLDSIIEAAIHG